jgi:RNA polymerase sigma-70 factor (ECF subfamily)
MSIAIRYAASKVEAEEIVNDAFFKLFNNVVLHKTEITFKPWFRRILINTAIDKYRTNKKHSNLVYLDNLQNNETSDLFLYNISAEEIIEILHTISPMYRMVFNLYVIEGYNHDEIAKILDITASTSRSNLSRAKLKLRDLIKNYRYYEKAW